MIITEKSEIKTGKVLIEFYADWCAPCKVTKPIVEDFGKNSADVKVYFCNVDEDVKSAVEHGVRSIPTIVYMENEEVKNRKVGVVKLSELIQMTNL